MQRWMDGWDWFLMNAAAVLLIVGLSVLVYVAVQAGKHFPHGRQL